MGTGDVVRRSGVDVLARSDVDRSSGGALIVAWQHPQRRPIEPVGLLEHGPELGYRFRYLQRSSAVEGFRPFLGFPDLRATYSAGSLFPLFSQRIMSDRRPDYSRFMEQLHLDGEATPWDQLARSEGHRTGDTVQVFPVPTVDVDGVSRCRFLVHGIGHVTGGDLPPLVAGDALQLVDEPDNPVHENAVLVYDSTGTGLGYVPGLLLEHLRALQREGAVEMTVEHVNGPEAPIHLRLLVRLVGSAPSGYRPMTGPTWATFEDGDSTTRSAM